MYLCIVNKFSNSSNLTAIFLTDYFDVCQHSRSHILHRAAPAWLCPLPRSRIREQQSSHSDAWPSVQLRCGLGRELSHESSLKRSPTRLGTSAMCRPCAKVRRRAWVSCGGHAPHVVLLHVRLPLVCQMMRSCSATHPAGGTSGVACSSLCWPLPWLRWRRPRWASCFSEPIWQATFHSPRCAPIQAVHACSLRVHGMSCCMEAEIQRHSHRVSKDAKWVAVRRSSVLLTRTSERRILACHCTVILRWWCTTPPLRRGG